MLRRVVRGNGPPSGGGGPGAGEDQPQSPKARDRLPTGESHEPSRAPVTLTKDRAMPIAVNAMRSSAVMMIPVLSRCSSLNPMS